MATLDISNEKLTDLWLDEKINECTTKIKRMLPKYKDSFPSACTTKMKYRIKPNDDWTNGFWTAMILMSYELTKDNEFKDTAINQLEDFDQRLKNHFVLDHHDIGFLYSLSAYAGVKVLPDSGYEQEVIDAADVLVSRFQEKGGFIQAWGALDDPTEYRLIIDSLLNLPLLFEAKRLTGNQVYERIGKEHYKRVIENIIRPDYSTYHTFYFNSENGKPVKGATHQGFSDDSCWARGQAWILLGMPLYHKFFKDIDESKLYKKLLNYYLAKVKDDPIPYWDLVFTAKDGQPKDSSAAAIVACGLIEAENQGYIDNGIKLARQIVYTLGEEYVTTKDQEGLLQHGVYAYSENKGVDEANLWGDYFYFEALMRLKNPSWSTYW